MKNFIFWILIGLVPLSVAHAEDFSATSNSCYARERGYKKIYFGSSRAKALEACKTNAKRPARCFVACATNGGTQPNNPQQCTFKEECGVGRTCLRHQCVREGGNQNRCISDFDCPSFYMCTTGGQCIPKPQPNYGPKQCISDFDCSSFQHCSWGVCR